MSDLFYVQGMGSPVNGFGANFLGHRDPQTGPVRSTARAPQGSLRPRGSASPTRPPLRTPTSREAAPPLGLSTPSRPPKRTCLNKAPAAGPPSSSPMPPLLCEMSPRRRLGSQPEVRHRPSPGRTPASTPGCAGPGRANWQLWDRMKELRARCDSDAICSRQVPFRWLCVARLDRGTVHGPFVNAADAKAELNRRTGSWRNRQMVCSMDRLGADNTGNRQKKVEGKSQRKGSPAGLRGLLVQPEKHHPHACHVREEVRRRLGLPRRPRGRPFDDMGKRRSLSAIKFDI